VREPEFLPNWYPLLLRRQRMVVAQAWVTVVVLAALAAWALNGQKQLHAAQRNLAAIKSQLVQTGADLQRLGEIEAIKRELEQQDKVLRRLGIHVPATRMISVIEDLMPPRMALSDLQMHTEELAMPLTEADRARGVSPKIRRKLQLTLDGLAPTEDDLATFLTRLVSVPYFGEVQLVKAQDAVDEERLTRRFEVMFAMDLDLSDPGADQGDSTGRKGAAAGAAGEIAGGEEEAR
jgi:Tfp pilus assembly protein PilN